MHHIFVCVCSCLCVCVCVPVCMCERKTLYNTQWVKALVSNHDRLSRQSPQRRNQVVSRSTANQLHSCSSVCAHTCISLCALIILCAFHTIHDESYPGVISPEYNHTKCHLKHLNPEVQLIKYSTWSNRVKVVSHWTVNSVNLDTRRSYLKIIFVKMLIGSLAI